MSISKLSSISGETKTAAKEVCRRAPESKGDLRTSRCTPVSVRSPAVGVLAAQVHGRALDAGHFAGAGLDQLDIKALGLAPAQVHAQQHLGPVLRLGAAAAGLDVQVGGVGIVLAGEHAPELEPAQRLVHRGQLGLDVGEHVGVAVGQRHVKELGGIGQFLAGLAQRGDLGLDLRQLAADVLRALRLVPEAGVGLFGLQLFKLLDQGLVVKDSPARRRDDPAGLQSFLLSGRFSIEGSWRLAAGRRRREGVPTPPARGRV